MSYDLKKLDPRVYVRAAKRVMKEGSTYQSCTAVACEVSFRDEELYKSAYADYFGPKDRGGEFVHRSYYGLQRANIKYAPRAVRAHPFWDRLVYTPEIQEQRATALLMMAEIVRSAKKSHS